MGKAPPVIDSDDLVSKPEATVKAYCNSVGIPFPPQALTWESKRFAEIKQWEGGWHTEVQSSQSFKERKRKDYVDIEAQEHLRQAYKFCLPYYQKLYQERLRVQ